MHPLDQATFERVTAGLGGAARTAATTAFEAFRSMPMPSPKEEVWRYVEIPVDLADVGLPTGPGAALVGDDRLAAAIPSPAGRAVVVDGYVLEIEDGMGPSLTEADSADRAAPGARVPADLDRYSAASQAFGTGGVVLSVPRGTTVATPYVVDVQATAAGAVSFPRVVVDAGDGAEVQVVIHLRSADGVATTVVPQIEVATGSNARVGVTTVQEWGDETVMVAHQRMVAGRDAAVASTDFGIGGRSARLHLTFDLAGPGADARFLGLNFGTGRQVLDYRAFVNHAAPATTSDMFLKGVVGDEAKSVFSGLIRIEPEGQKTNAHQTNRNLVLSDGAEAHSVPNLEILANDVRCGHGSAVGPLDEEQRYYLMSRGLDRDRADRLQVKGFFEEVLARFAVASLEPPLRRTVMAKYDEFVAGGRR